MTIVVQNNGEKIALEYLVNKNGNTEDLVYRLYTNTITIAETDTAASYTEAAGGGYVAKTLTGSSWTITPGDPTTATYAQQQWDFTGALTGPSGIKGYYVTRATTGDLVYSESFGATFTPATNGDYARVTPTLTGA